MGLGGAAVLAPAPQTEQLVEGHTVFTVIEQVTTECPISRGLLDPFYDAWYGTEPACVPQPSTNGTEYAAAVAVLVRERIQRRTPDVDIVQGYRFPGVLWFNDQYLVNPAYVEPVYEIRPDKVKLIYRYPCTGAVIAVNSGDPVPMVNGTATNAGATYVESYHITDPNDRAWDVDKWSWTTGGGNVTMWTVPLMNDHVRSPAKDDGKCSKKPQSDGCPRGYCQIGNVNYGPVDAWAKDPGANGLDYPCENATGTCKNLQYNAVLYFLLQDLTDAGPDKNHTEGSVDWSSDASGCHDNSTSPYTDGYYSCPGDDDDREGNSHPYNPNIPYTYAGLGDHGGSTASGAPDQHVTRRIDLRYGVATPPPVRYYRVVDVEGSTAPYHCHEDEPCAAYEPYV